MVLCLFGFFFFGVFKFRGRGLRGMSFLDKIFDTSVLIWFYAFSKYSRREVISGCLR